MMGSRRVHGTYWRRIRDKWGPRRLDEPTPLEIGQFAEETRRNAVVRRNHRGGTAAGEHLIAALRCIYQFAIAVRGGTERDDQAITSARGAATCFIDLRPQPGQAWSR